MRERDRVTDRARRQRQWSETGVRKAKASADTEPDKSARAARAERSAKQAAKVRATERAREAARGGRQAVAPVGLHLRFGGGERSGDVTVRLDGAVLRRGDFLLGPLDVEPASGERAALVGPNGSGTT